MSYTDLSINNISMNPKNLNNNIKKKYYCSLNKYNNKENYLFD